MIVYFRDLNSAVVEAVREAFPEWDVACAPIFEPIEDQIDVIISPANCTGRMCGGIDLVYLQRFGFDLQTRLMKDIVDYHGGRLPIGQAHLIKTHEQEPGIPWMISAPTMDWPPGDVSHTDNAYLAFKGALHILTTDLNDEYLRDPVVLMPGLATNTGRMTGPQAAQQMRRAWNEFF